MSWPHINLASDLSVTPIVFVMIGLVSSLTALGLLQRGRLRGRIWWPASAAAAFVFGCGIFSMQLISATAIAGAPIVEKGLLLTASTLAVTGVLAFGAFQVMMHAKIPLMWAAVGAALGAGLCASQQLLLASALLPIGFNLTEESMVLALGGSAVLGAATMFLFRRLPGSWALWIGATGLMVLQVHIASGLALGSEAAFSWASAPTARRGDMPPAFFVTIAIVIVAASALLFGSHRHRQAGAEMERMRALADVAFEGIVVCKNGVIVHANSSFASLIGLPGDSLTGTPFASLIVDPSFLNALSENDIRRVEAEIRGAEGTQAVEIFTRHVVLQDSRHRVYAIRDIRERKLAEARIQFLAHHDSVTGLPNRTQFLDRLEQEMNRSSRSGGQFAVICLDLDRFKEVNDTFGHGAGDQLLRLAAERLKRVFRTYDVVGRVGGDEFIVMQCASIQPDSAITASRRLVAAFAEPFDLDGLKITIGASAGIAVYPNDAEDAEGLLTRADLALYRAKNSGRGTFRLFEPGMDEQLRERRVLATDLRCAVLNDDITLHYQPIVRLSDGEVTGFEALPRWKHHTRGWINPSIFLPLAEEIGLIPDLCKRVMRRACAEAVSWPNALSISVNVAPTQLHGALVALVSEALAETRLSPQRLEIDVTEQILQQRHAGAGETLGALRALGVRIAIDHFGTGATSLPGLRDFLINRIKMDASFVSSMTDNLDNMALVRAICSLGRALGIEVSAAGCDSHELIELLKHEGCLEAQGDIFGAPMPIIAFAHMTGRYQAENEAQQRAVAG